MQNFFLTLKWNFWYFNLCTLSLVLLLYLLKRVCHYFLDILPSGICINKIPWAFSSPGSWPSLLCDMLLAHGQHFHWDLLYVGFFLVVCWSFFVCLFSAKLLFNQSRSSMYCYMGLFLPSAGLCISSCGILWNTCQPISPAFWGPSEWQHNHLMYQHSTLFCTLSALLRVYTVRSFRSLMKVLNSSAPITVCRRTPLMTALQMEFMESQPFEPSDSASFQPTLLYICLACTASPCLGRRFGKHCWKASCSWDGPH